MDAESDEPASSVLAWTPKRERPRRMGIRKSRTRKHLSNRRDVSRTR